jgi:CRP-like cAMP-binding protein
MDPQSQVVAAPRSRNESQGVRVLDLDADLGRRLDGVRLAQARAQLFGCVLTLARGAWGASSLRGAGPRYTGLLVVEGLMARELVMGSQVSTELFGPGDLLRPWEDEESLLPMVARWNVLSPVRAVVLGPAFTARMCDFPEVSAELLARVHTRAQRLAETQAICHAGKVELRVHAMLWHLADRWGRVTAEGTVVPLTLSHRILGELVGARRPTVSTALTDLDRRGAVARRDDGTWLLLGSPPGSRRSEPPRLEAVGARRSG